MLVEGRYNCVKSAKLTVVTFSALPEKRAQASGWTYCIRRRDNADATFSMSDYSPLSFLLLSREKDRRREYDVQYNPQTKTLVGSVKRKNRIREQSLPAGNVYDPVSALYLLRSRELVPGTPVEDANLHWPRTLSLCCASA